MSAELDLDDVAATSPKAMAELEALRADAERLDAIERGLWFVQPRYEDVPARWTVGKAGSVNRYKTLRAAIDAARRPHDAA